MLRAIRGRVSSPNWHLHAVGWRPRGRSYGSVDAARHHLGDERGVRAVRSHSPPVDHRTAQGRSTRPGRHERVPTQARGAVRRVGVARSDGARVRARRPRPRGPAGPTQLGTARDPPVVGSLTLARRTTATAGPALHGRSASGLDGSPWAALDAEAGPSEAATTARSRDGRSRHAEPTASCRRSTEVHDCAGAGQAWWRGEQRHRDASRDGAGRLASVRPRSPAMAETT